MKPIQQHKDPRITNVSFDNLTGSVYIINRETTDENPNQSMLTSPRTNAADHFVPSHHLALITQPVLGARSRSRKKTTTTTNIIVETSPTTKDKFHSMANSHRGSYNDSPPLILPNNRVDTSQYPKKTNSNSQHESSDSGLDLSSSTNSSVQFQQQYPQQHIIIHRPLSALNEDSSPDDGYHDEHQQVPLNAVRLRFPPLNFGRNRSMEDIVSNNKHEQQQHRSSSFTDERQQNLSLREDKKLKRSSDGALLDLFDTSTESYRRSNTIKNELLYPSTTQHRSLNDLTNRTSNRVLPIRNESNMSININNLSTTQTIIRKPNTSKIKPLRKKTKLNIIIEPSVPLTSSRLDIYDEQINTMAGTTSSSSNQTTPRSTQPLGQQQQQQQIKSKIITPLGYYPNQEQMRAHVNRSVVERQHPPAPSCRGVIKQLIPFDASPSKINNLLLRHHVQQQQPAVLFHPSSNTQLSPSRQVKQTSRTLYNEETISIIEEEKRKQKEQINIENFQEQVEKQGSKQREEFENNKSNETHEKVQRRIKDIQQQNSHDYIDQRDFIKSNQRQQEKELILEKNQKKKIEKNRFIQKNENIDQRQQTDQMFTSTPRQQYQQSDIGGYYRDENQHRRRIIKDSNRNITKERYGSGQSNKLQDTKNINRRQQRNVRYVDDSLHTNRSDGLDKKQRIHQSKPTQLLLRNKPHNNINDKNSNQTTELNSQYGIDYSHRTQKNTLLTLQSRPSKVHFQPFETSPIARNPILLTQTDQNSKQGNEHYAWQKSQGGSMSKPIRIQPILSTTNTNNYNSRRERETSQLSNMSKTDSIQIKQKIMEKNSTGSFQSRSPTSSSLISEQQFEISNKTNPYQPESLSSQDESIENNSSTPRTYRLMINDQQQQPLDGRYVIPSNNLRTPSLVDHSYPYTFTPNLSPPKQKSIVSDVYILSDRDNTQKTIDRQNSSSPSVHHSSNKKFYSPPPPPSSSKQTISTEKDEILSNNDSDDGWSDDSAELLYVDERYVTEKRKITSSSHLPSQQYCHYQVQQQQNVLLQ